YAEISKRISPSEESQTIIDSIKSKKESSFDSMSVRKLKGNIRRGESYTATRYLGLDDSNVHFLDLPFYETGTIKKNNLSKADIDIVLNIIKEIKPHQIYAAGDLADPHGTHKVCLDAIFAAVKKLKSEPFMKDCWIWLYRGAWHEWDINEIEMAVPMSPDQVLKKRYAIFCHQSQKDGVMFQGDDAREFWMRAEERNKGTAAKYRALGLSDYAAMEAFVRHKFE
ncbi:MAG: glucosamine-6-phosphate deaminase, partial [Flavobacteriaceae bacterium]